jgi:hypothetical protein
MTDITCHNSECTVAQTGICLLNNVPDACPNRVHVAEGMAGGRLFDEPVLSAPSTTPRFPPSAALGTEDVRSMLCESYGRIIGVLGAPDSGKTACLVSLYLLLAHNKLEGFTFADSKSLMALDELSRGARRWNGAPPEQMTAHTELGADRSAGFLHLKLVRNVDGTRVNLLIPDLPGEWSTTLIDSNRVDRLGFLRSAHEVWMMVDGRSLADKSQRRNAIHRANVLVDRIVDLCGASVPRLRLVVTRLDQGNPVETTLQELRDHAAQRGVELAISHIASFSNSEGTPAGAGIADLIGETVVRGSQYSEFWPDGNVAGAGSRYALRLPRGESK